MTQRTQSIEANLKVDPKRFENPKILIANTPMDTDKIKIYGAKVKVDSVAAVADIEEAEKERMRAKAKKILPRARKS